MMTAEAIYGSGFAMRMRAEKRCLENVGRMPGLPSSHVALECALGVDEEIEFEDFLNTPADSPAAPFKVREAMEVKFGLM